MSKIFSLPLMGVVLRSFSSLSYSLPSCSVSKRLHFNSFQHIYHGDISHNFFDFFCPWYFEFQTKCIGNRKWSCNQIQNSMYQSVAVNLIYLFTLFSSAFY